MKQVSLVSAAMALLLRPATSLRLGAEAAKVELAPRATPSSGNNNPDYADAVCKPATKDLSNLPPCVEIENIAILCTPNGTAPLYLQAHAQCMCGGSFFSEWAGCQSCLFVHGLRSPRDMALYSSVIATVSTELCVSPTPAAPFSALFSSAAEAATPVTTGVSTLTDLFPSQTAISLYYTASGSQGPGAITGSAAKATNTGGIMTAPPMTTTTGSAGGSASAGGLSSTQASGSTTGAGTSSSTTQSANAAPTHQAGKAFVGVAAAAVLAVAL